MKELVYCIITNSTVGGDRMLKVRKLEKRLQDHLVLKDLDMDVDDGCIYGLIGSLTPLKTREVPIVA